MEVRVLSSALFLAGNQWQAQVMDLKDPRLIKLKAALFLVIALLASGLLLLRTPELGSVALLVLALWAACRCYYFAFYVLQHYVDPSFRYSGLGSLVRHLFKARRKNGNDPGV